MVGSLRVQAFVLWNRGGRGYGGHVQVNRHQCHLPQMGGVNGSIEGNS